MKRQKQLHAGLVCLTLIMSVSLGACGKMAEFNDQVIYKSAARAHNKGDYPRAIELYTKILRNNPGFSTVRYELAVAYLDARQFKEANKQIKILREQKRDDLAMELEKLSHIATSAK